MKPELSPHIRRLEELILGFKPNVVEYEGGIHGTALFREREIAVQVASTRKPAYLDRHAHAAVEVIVVFSGRFIFEFDDGKEEEVKTSQVIRIPIGVPHACRADAESRAIGILIPAEKGYPDVSR